MGVDRVFSKKKHFYEESVQFASNYVKRDTIVSHISRKLFLRRVYF